MAVQMVFACQESKLSLKMNQPGKLKMIFIKPDALTYWEY